MTLLLIITILILQMELFPLVSLNRLIHLIFGLYLFRKVIAAIADSAEAELAATAVKADIADSAE